MGAGATSDHARRQIWAVPVWFVVFCLLALVVLVWFVVWCWVLVVVVVCVLACVVRVWWWWS